MRLINADALKEMICNNVYPIVDFFNSRDYGMFWTGGIEKAIDEAPTIEAVEVVRCKDCRWYINDRLKRDGTEDNRYAPSICNLHGRPHSNTYFCADGEVE